MTARMDRMLPWLVGLAVITCVGLGVSACVADDTARRAGVCQPAEEAMLGFVDDPNDRTHADVEAAVRRAEGEARELGDDELADAYVALDAVWGPERHDRTAFMDAVDELEELCT